MTTAQGPDSVQDEQAKYTVDLPQRYRFDFVFATATWIATAIGLVVLAILLIDILTDGTGRLSLNFLSNNPSSRPALAGVRPALFGTLWLLALTTLFAFPIGVGAGIYLEEFAADNRLTQFIEINISNLAGVPSIIYGLLGLAFFVRVMAPITGGRSVLSGALTLALLVLPIIIVATRESLRTVPNSLRQAGLALGATKWQVIWEQILPLAFPGILTGTILALSRAIGETAPLIVIGAATFITTIPGGLQDRFTALPIQIYDWVSRPKVEFHRNAAGAIIVLMVVLLLMNATAVFLRNKYQKARQL
ncbi:MAG: phosphate ABC transporter permease PstA [Leptolyngbyaceae cyanobacterium bins.59]|nr:phosphate ABC transporter permease PstA [Leptolyngbyaceae cyanobacterium bins.59]